MSIEALQIETGRRTIGRPAASFRALRRLGLDPNLAVTAAFSAVGLAASALLIAAFSLADALPLAALG